MSEPLLGVEHVAIRAGTRKIVDDVSFAAHAGELTVVIGPNGAGKTSLLEAVVGLRAAAGSVSVSGQQLTGFAARARTFAYLPDQSEPPVEASVRTLVEHAIACSRDVTRAVELRRSFGVDALLELGAGVLSRGERQRVALFCTLALARPVVVLDEPFSVFDPLQLRHVLRALRSVAASGTAIVASVHQLADAEKAADRVLLLAGGRALAFGTLAELRAGAGTGASQASLEEIFVTLLDRGQREA